MMTPVLLGLTGHKRSGKDTAANRLSQHHYFTRIALADPVRQVLSALNPVVEVTIQSRAATRPSQWFHETSRMTRMLEQALQRYTVGVDATRDLYAKAIEVVDPYVAEGIRINDCLAAVNGDWDQLKEGSDKAPAEVITEVRD